MGDEMGVALKAILADIESARLARLIDVDGDSAVEWDDGRLAKAWADLLVVPLDLHSMRASAITGPPVPPSTVGELIRHAQPEREWLLALKDYAHQHRVHPSSPIPLPVVTVLYYLSLVLAGWRCRCPISGLSNAEVTRGIRWVLRQNWIDPATRAVFNAALCQAASESELVATHRQP